MVMTYRFRLIVERWDYEEQRAIRVLNRVYRTYKGAEKRALRYQQSSRAADYRETITPLTSR